jgi:hypothetical protein
MPATTDVDFRRGPAAGDGFGLFSDIGPEV